MSETTDDPTVIQLPKRFHFILKSKQPPKVHQVPGFLAFQYRPRTPKTKLSEQRFICLRGTKISEKIQTQEIEDKGEKEGDRGLCPSGTKD